MKPNLEVYLKLLVLDATEIQTITNTVKHNFQTTYLHCDLNAEKLIELIQTLKGNLNKARAIKLFNCLLRILTASYSLWKNTRFPFLLPVSKQNLDHNNLA